MFVQLNATSTKALDDAFGTEAADEPKDVPGPSRSEADEVGAEKESPDKPGDPMANKLNATSTKAIDHAGATKAADEPKDEPIDVPAPSRSDVDEVGAEKKSVDKPGDPMANKTGSPAKSHGDGSSEESDSEDESSEDDGEGVYRTVWLAKANGRLPIRVWIKRPRYLNDPKILGAGRGLRANRGGK
ncbi:uncharacterized protein LOC144172931 isoform X1 [Haemaphysalis longicornis]